MITKIANFFALGGAIGGSTLVASNLGLAFLGYILCLASSVASAYLLIKTRGAPKSLILQNLFFVVVNVVGIVRYGS
jgi:hypothetical protein